LDDAPLKQNTYCPGTSIPVMATESIRNIGRETPLAIVILAWNFWDEIANNILEITEGFFDGIIVLIPFPSPRLLRLQHTSEGHKKHLLRELYYNPTPLPNPIRDKNRRKVHLYTHQRNEELLMPFFIIQHAPMFDSAILIDYLSDDDTLKIIQDYAPNSWNIVRSTTNRTFDARKCDDQVIAWEKKNSKDWALALTTTEFLIHPNLRVDLWRYQEDIRKGPQIMRISSFTMVGNDTMPLQHYTSLPKQRHVSLKKTDSYRFFDYERFIHFDIFDRYRYSVGRHGIENLNGTQLSKNKIPVYEGGFIMKFSWTPWPEQLQRMIQVGSTIPSSDIKERRGMQHVRRARNGKDFIEREREGYLSAPLQDFCDDMDNAYINYGNIFTKEYGEICEV